MKKIFLVVLIAVAVIVSGCGDKTAGKPAPEADVDAVLVADSFFVIESENMSYLTDAIARKDTEYLNQLMLEGKVFKVDKDTKVTRFGVAADENNVLIKFKEGRYTNKAGCTFKQRVYTEEEYQRYLDEKEAKNQAKAEALKQEVFGLMQEYLANTEDYSTAISTGDLEEVNRLVQVCSNEKNKMVEHFVHYGGLGFYDCIEKTELIIKERYNALTFYQKLIEFTRKLDEEGSSSPNFTYYQNCKIEFGKGTDEHLQKAEQLRQEFRNKYGY